MYHIDHFSDALPMCGFAGWISQETAPADLGQRWLSCLAHRGPDDQGLLQVGDHVLLAHRRLAVIDPDVRGRQPMERSHGGKTWAICFNGMIYNYQELREELQKSGYDFQTKTDTEVILFGFCKWGYQVFAKLRGMFAVAIASEDGVWLARDRVGMKPLYFYAATDRFLFASEVRAINLGRKTPPKISMGAVESLLSQGAVFGSQSIYEDVFPLPPGEAWFIDHHGERRERHEIIAPAFDPQAPYHEAVQRYIADTVTLHARSDRPLGLFLSSGVDSTALLAAAKTSGLDLDCINIGFKDSAYDESAGARAIAAKYGATLRTSTLDVHLIRDHFDEVVQAMDQPTVDGFNTYFVAKAAVDAGLTVALSGLGGDELFAGYATFRDIPRWLHTPLPNLSSIATPLAKWTGRRSLWKLCDAWQRPKTLAQTYFLRREVLSPDLRRLCFPLPGAADPFAGVPAADLEAFTETGDLINDISRLEQQWYMRDMLLRDVDNFGMAHGLEIRSPFTDPRLVAAINAIPGQAKIKGGGIKPLLVKAMGEDFPPPGRKRGFALPWEEWLRGPLADRVDALRHDEVLLEAGFAKSSVGSIVDRFFIGDGRVSATGCLSLLVLATYLRQRAYP